MYLSVVAQLKRIKSAVPSDETDQTNGKEGKKIKAFF